MGWFFGFFLGFFISFPKSDKEQQTAEAKMGYATHTQKTQSGKVRKKRKCLGRCRQKWICVSTAWVVMLIRFRFPI